MENGKPNALSHIWEWVCVHEWHTSHFPTQSQFSYLTPIGVRKSRDSPVSSIDLITSDHLKTFTSFLQGLKLHFGKGTRDSRGHPEHSPVAQRGHHIPQHNPAAAVAQPKQHGGLHRLKFTELALRCFLAVHPAVYLSWEVCYANEFPRLTMIFMEIFRTSFSSRCHKRGSWRFKAQLPFAIPFLYLQNREARRNLKTRQNLCYCFQLY